MQTCMDDNGADIRSPYHNLHPQSPSLFSISIPASISIEELSLSLTGIEELVFTFHPQSIFPFGLDLFWGGFLEFGK